MNRQNLECVRGDTWARTVTFTLAEGTLDGARVYMTIKSRQTDLDEDAVAQIDTEGGGVEITGETTARVTLTAAVTALFGVKTYFYDVQVVLESGDVETAVMGDFVVVADATRATE